MLMYLNVFSYWHYLLNNFKSKRYTLHQSRCSSYKVIMYIQKLHHFCNTSSPDDGPKLGRKYSGNKQLWKIYQSIPTKYHKNQNGNMKGSTRKYVDRKNLIFNEICINEEMLPKYTYIYIYIFLYDSRRKSKG